MKNNSVIAGVFCDIQGTLLDYGAEKINEEVLEMLEGYEKEGKAINLWTGGDVEEFRTKIRKLGIKYRVLSKYDFENRTVEIAIDDQPEKKILKDYGIKTECFIFYDTGAWDEDSK